MKRHLLAPTTLALGLACAPSPGDTSRVRQRPVVDAGSKTTASDVADAAAQIARTDPAAPDTGVAPVVVSTYPELDAQDVYPSPFGDGRAYRFEVRVEFSAEMDTSIDAASFGPVLQDATARQLEWSSDGRSALLHVAPPPLAAQILLDETEYRLDLSALRAQSGARLDANTQLRETSLWFTTGTHDALLNHSCGHTVFGPFASGAASLGDATPTFIATETHTQYGLTLPPGGDNGTAAVGLKLAIAGRYRLYFDQILAIEIARAERTDPLVMRPSPASCPGIRAQADVEVAAAESLVLRMHALDSKLLQLIIESNPD